MSRKRSFGESDPAVKQILQKNTLRILERQALKKTQYKLYSNMQINGIPETKHEDLIGLVIKIAAYAGVLLTPNDILEVFRERHKSGSINVKFRNNGLKMSIEAGVRYRGGVSTRDLNIPGENKRLYMHDQLTSYNQKLFAKCRALGKANKYKYIWTKYGQIYVRKDDLSPVIRVNTEEDLLRLV